MGIEEKLFPLYARFLCLPMIIVNENVEAKVIIRKYVKIILSLSDTLYLIFVIGIRISHCCIVVFFFDKPL